MRRLAREGQRINASEIKYNELDPIPVPKKGQIILAMGGKPVKALQSARVLPGNLSILRLRGQAWRQKSGGYYMVTNDPFTVQVEPMAVGDIQWDVRLASRLLTTGTLKPKVGNYRYVTGYQKVVDWVKRQADKTGSKVMITEDLETLGLDPWNPEGYIVSISFTVKIGTAHIMPFHSPNPPSDRILRQIEWLENADEVSLGGANLKYDNLWKKVVWGLNWPKSFKFDTLLGGSLCNENRRNGLNTHAKIYTGMGGYDDSFNANHDKARMDLVLKGYPDDFRDYSGGDTDSCAQARIPIVEEIRSDPWLSDFYTTILHPASRVFEKIEYEGITVDSEALLKVGDICDEEAAKAHTEMYALVPQFIVKKHSGKTGDRLKFTPNVLKEIFFGSRGWKLKPQVVTDKTKEPSTSVDGHLKRFADHPQAGKFLQALKRKNKAEKIKSSYVKGFLDHLRSDGKFHPTFSLHVGSIYESAKEDDGGTVTGRTAAKYPHVQTLPKRWKPGDYNWPDALRACYPAPPGYLIGEIDYSQGELKIHAMLANEPTMLQLFREGKDMHLLTGCRSEGITYEQGLLLEESNPKLYKRIRYGAKAQNFGLIYLQTPPGFQNYAYREWDLDYSLMQCEEIHESFFSLYTKLKKYAVARQNEAREEGMVRSPLGRIRHLPLATSKDRRAQSKALRQAVNSPTQSVLSDLGLWSMAIADQEGLIDQGLRIFNFVHDAVQFYFPDTSKGFDLVNRMGYIMENLPFHEICDWEPELKMTVDAEIGPVLNQLKGIKLSHQLPSN